MRSLITALGLASSIFAFACDAGTSDGPDVAAAPASISANEEPEAFDPMLVATCHADYREAFDRIETARAEAATCKADSDCTVAVAETRCTGELTAAVASASEARFLGFIERVDARLCADAPAECAPVAAADPDDVTVACIANRCTLAGE